jgi:ribosomal protein S18 acetylase RimI-like enzyme
MIEKPAKANDLSHLASMLYRLFGLGENKSIFPYVRKDAFMRFYNSHRVLYRVNDEGVPVGLLTYMQYLRSSKKQIGVAYDVQLCEIVVDPEYKGAGVARSLFAELESLARLAGARHVVLSVRKDNARACRFYEKMGMQVVGEKTWNEKRKP